MSDRDDYNKELANWQALSNEKTNRIQQGETTNPWLSMKQFVSEIPLEISERRMSDQTRFAPVMGVPINPTTDMTDQRQQLQQKLEENALKKYMDTHK